MSLASATPCWALLAQTEVDHRDLTVLSLLIFCRNVVGSCDVADVFEQPGRGWLGVCVQGGETGLCWLPYAVV
jgi:hypothetical protein